MEYYLETVKCGDLMVDDTYQREIVPYWLNKIKKNYDQSLVRPLVLSSRRNRKLYVIDGNHTRTATMELFGPGAELPAKIYSGLTVQQEAELFYKLNSNSKKTSYNNNLKAQYASGDEFIVDYVDALNESGIKWKFTGAGGACRYFVAHNAGTYLYKKYGRSDFVSACGILANTGDREMLTRWMLTGVCYLLSHTSLSPDSITNTLRKITADDIAKRARYYGMPDHGLEATGKLYAMAFLDFYNKGRRNKVKLNSEV